jgi:hypothetical protein
MSSRDIVQTPFKNVKELNTVKAASYKIKSLGMVMPPAKKKSSHESSK